MTDTHYSWNTTKNDDGSFSFTVTKMTALDYALPNGHYCLTEVQRNENGFKSRSRAKGRAIKWIRYFRATQISENDSL